MHRGWFWALLGCFCGVAMGQVGFSAKTPMGGWLQTHQERDRLGFALGATGKSVWLPGDELRWRQSLSDPFVPSPAQELAAWWLSEDWRTAQEESPPSVTLTARARWFAAKQLGERTSWERFDALTLSYHPQPRWGVLVQVRHRDLLPLLDARRVPSLEVATVRGFVGTTVWELGRNYYRWGPGFWGTALLSDSGYPIDGVSVSLSLKLPLIGRWRVRQLMAYLHGDREGRFFLARRWERQMGQNWTIGGTEVNLSPSFPPPTYLFLPIYPASRLAIKMGWRKERTDQVLVNADVTWRSKAMTLYGVALADDLRLRETEKRVERKLGWIFGGQWETERWTLGAEYAHFDRNTYTHTLPVLDYSYHGIGLGYPTGRDSRMVSVWGRWKILPHWQVTGVLARSQLERHTARDTERYWAVGLQWAVNPQTLLTLHWTRGFPPLWGVSGGWTEDQERRRFVLLELRYNALWASTVPSKREGAAFPEQVPPKREAAAPAQPLEQALPKPVAPALPETAFALLTSVRGNTVMLSAGSKQGLKPKMRLPVLDPMTEKVIAYVVLSKVRQEESIGQLQMQPGSVVRVGSKVLLRPEP